MLTPLKANILLQLAVTMDSANWLCVKRKSTGESGAL